MTSIRDMMKEPIKPKRNFLRENKGLIHKIEEQNRAKRNNIVDVPKNKKYSNVQSKVHAIIHGTGSDKAEGKHRKDEVDLIRGGHRLPKSVCDEAVQVNEMSILASSSRQNRSTQTLSDISELEGPVIIPSDRAWKSVSMDSLHLGIPSESNSPSRAHQLTQRSLQSSSDHHSEEHITVAGRVTWQQNVNKERITEDPLRVPKSYQKGVVPRYLRVRHEEQAREAERAIREAKDPDCPPGHRKLTVEEQKESLEKLKATQNELLVQLNRLPVQLHTLRAQNQRRMLDEELDKVERLIVAFSKPKVFVELQHTDTG